MLLLHEELSCAVIGAAHDVHRILGPVCLEAVYTRALAHELSLRHIPFERQILLPVIYKDVLVGEYRADFVVDQKLVLEIKAVSAIVSAHEAQGHHYLTATGLRLAILLNFGASSLQMKRIIR